MCPTTILSYLLLCSLLILFVAMTICLNTKIKSGKKTGNNGLNQAIGNMMPPLRGITAFFHRAHHECGKAGTTPDKEVTFIETQMKDSVDFIGLSEYEASNTIDASKYNFGMIGASCKYNYSEPVRLYYNKNDWNKVDSYPKSKACQDPENPPGGSAVAPWQCGPRDVVPTNTAEGICCACTYAADKADDGGSPKQVRPMVRDRAWVAGIFEQYDNLSTFTVCVVATGMIHPYPVENITPEGTGTIAPEVANFCGSSHPIIFMADTNLVNPKEKTGSLFKEKPLSDLRDAAKPRWTCCKNDHAKHASDRIAVTGTLVIETITGGASSSGGQDFPDDMGYQCEASVEHLPIKAFIV